MKTIITEADVRLLARQGSKELSIDSNTILTDLAREAAKTLGLKLSETAADTDRPMANTVLPYLAPDTVRVLGPAPARAARAAAAAADLSPGGATADAAYWESLRRLFPIFRSKRYFASCSQGALCTRVEGAVAKFMDSWRMEGNPWEAQWIPTVNAAAEKYGRLIGAAPNTIGITASVSAGMATVLSSLDFSRRRKVVVGALEFPTVPDILIAYRDRGLIDLEHLPEVGGDVPLSLYERAIDDRTALVCISAVSYATGSQFPVAEIARLAHRHGALCLLDAYQGVGALRLDVNELDVDFALTGTQKYLIGTSGVGLVYVRPALSAALRPRDIGWMAVANPFAVEWDGLEYAAGGARFQGGTFTISGCYAADAALDLLLEIGPQVINDRVLGLTRRFAGGLRELGIKPTGPDGPGQLGPMVAVPVPGDAYRWQESLVAEEQLVTSARGAAIRFAFHFYNNDEDVDAALAALARRLTR